MTLAQLRTALRKTVPANHYLTLDDWLHVASNIHSSIAKELSGIWISAEMDNTLVKRISKIFRAIDSFSIGTTAR